MMMMDEVKHKSSRRDDSGRKEEKTKRIDREQREKDRNREKHRDRRRESSRRRCSEKERSLDDNNKHREKNRDRDLRYNEDREKDRHDRKRRRRDEEDYRERRDRSRSDRYRDDHDERRRKKSKEDLDIKQKRSRELDLEEEQRNLDEVMDKRRKRVHALQELKRKTEESEREKKGESYEPKSGRNWILEGEESDDEEEEKALPSIKKEENEMDMDEDDNVTQDGGEGANGEEGEIDSLDAFMNFMELQEVYGKDGNKSKGRIMQGEDSDSDYEDSESNDASREDEDEDDNEFTKRVKKPKAEKLSLVDHSKIQYPPFRKNFYIEVKEISRMTFDEVASYKKQLELTLYGKDVPKPIKTWVQTGLVSKILDTIKKHGFEKPLPIQAQALPIIMSGRDCIGVAKTGSGKTLAFVLPMLRHIKDQSPLEQGDGPIGLIIAPTRELVQQIHSDIRKFAKVLNIRSVAVYGGSGIAQQISELKHGTEIVVCTPGRMIDVLCKNSGKITNLRRVTYLVMDEADRMFDMGFEPQITHIVQNTRPDRQTVLFSATFPGQVEILARKVLIKPVKMQIGGRSVVNKDITQLVEVRAENDRFLRLLELLGEWREKGKILIFVHSQEKCDSLFRDLLKHGYLCLSLHGAKDQIDRQDTISDFKSNVRNVLIATSIAARGLDVNDLELVINFDVPNHYEEYVHRVGRTGRAGRKGCAITFISEDDARYSPDLVKALELSEQAVPGDLKALADGFMAKVNQGLEKFHGTGYGGSGFKFNEEEDEDRKAAKKALARGHARDYGLEEDKSDSDSEDEGIRKTGGHLSQQAALAQVVAIGQVAAIAAASRVPTPVSGVQLLPNGGIPGTLPGVHGLTIPGTEAVLPANGAARAAALEAAKNLQHNIQKIQQDAIPEHYEAEFEINDFPQNARSKVIKEALGRISEWTGAAITTRGKFCSKGKVPGPGERKLYLFIEGSTESSVKRAKTEVKRVLEDIMR